MILSDVTAELGERLHQAVGQVYEVPPAGQPELPCVIIGFPIIEAFHNDFAHSLTRLTVDLDIMVGRGDGEEAFRQLADLISTDNPGSVPSVLGEGRPARSWARLTCISTTTPRDEGDSVSLQLSIEIDA